MSPTPIVRSVCVFSAEPTPEAAAKLLSVCTLLEDNGIPVQTRRILSPVSIDRFREMGADEDVYFNVGTISVESLELQLASYRELTKVSCHIDLTGAEPTARHVNVLFDLMRTAPEKTFYFSYSINAPASSPYFPSATYARDGFSIGLQSTNLAEGCVDLAGWLTKMRSSWQRIIELLGTDPDFIGIDSSVAPLGAGSGSLVHFVRALHGSLRNSLITDFYVTLTEFLKTQNPAPIGFCGLMLPCLEDSHLAEEYESGGFDLPTNLLLSLNSGVGVDTYPIGRDEDPEVVLRFLRLVRSLSLKHSKPLSVRFVSDGDAKIGERTAFGNKYLTDVTVRPLSPELPRNR